MEHKKAILSALQRAQKSQFGVKAIKVELEAQLYRNLGEEACLDFICEQIADDLGEDVDRDYTELTTEGAISFMKFYRDGSVDSELTFTVRLNNPENIFIVPRVIEAFKALSEHIGNGLNVQGAGLHTAFLSNEEGTYPDHNFVDNGHFRNFKRSMTMLLPALYFLAASQEESRGLDFRRPSIGYDTHRAAIDLREGALEFRIFDTCYDNPEQFLDNVVVMCNTMKYWTQEYTPTGVEKIATHVGFGTDNNNRLDRFYTSYKHVDLLNWGLKKLKPSYRTITELKKARRFEVSKRGINKKRREIMASAKSEYKEYLDRFEYRLKRASQYYGTQLIREMQYNLQIGHRPVEMSAEDFKARIEARVEAERNSLISEDNWVRQRVDAFDNGEEGSYTLRAE